MDLVLGGTVYSPNFRWSCRVEAHEDTKKAARGSKVPNLDAASGLSTATRAYSAHLKRQEPQRSKSGPRVSRRTSPSTADVEWAKTTFANPRAGSHLFPK